MINRHLTKEIQKRLENRKPIILFGPRQVGKTTLIRDLLNNYPGKTLAMNGDEADIRDMLRTPTSTMLKNLTAGYKLVFIDEAQKIDGIGNVIKLFCRQHTGCESDSDRFVVLCSCG